jgi:hypothetical protein
VAANCPKDMALVIVAVVVKVMSAVVRV